MNVLFLEDNYDAAKIKNSIEERGFNVYPAPNIIDAEDLLETDIQFHAAIVDLDMDKNYLSPELLEEAKDYDAGWVFYKYILRTIPPIDKNTIILSALATNFERSMPPEEIADVVIIDKRNTKSLELLLDALNKIKNQLDEEVIDE